MSGISKDAKKINRAQKAYDTGVDCYLEIIEETNEDILQINDLLHGYAMSKEGAKYALDPQQYSALRDRLNFWMAFMKSPDKVFANTGDRLRKRAEQHTKKKPKKNNSNPGSVAVFDTTAKKKQ